MAPSTLYDDKARQAKGPVEPKRSRQHSVQPRALSQEERDGIGEVLNSERFQDSPPAEVYETLLEEGVRYCSVSTMQRILRQRRQNGERRLQTPAQSHAIPRLSASQPNQVWTWDCSKLATLSRGVYLTLYVVLDLYSRYVLAWMISTKENSALARQLMDEAYTRYRIEPWQLTIHQDRGSPMTAYRYIDQMVDLQVCLSHSRPRVSNDNPFSESQFKTQKHQPDYPGRFLSAAHGRQWHADYFHWYNHQHHHSGLFGYTPEQVFTGRWKTVAATKQCTLDAAYQAHPERFVTGPPKAKAPPPIVTINPITSAELDAGATDAVNFPTLSAVKARMPSNIA